MTTTELAVSEHSTRVDFTADAAMSPARLAALADRVMDAGVAHVLRAEASQMSHLPGYAEPFTVAFSSIPIAGGLTPRQGADILLVLAGGEA